MQRTEEPTTVDVPMAAAAETTEDAAIAMIRLARRTNTRHRSLSRPGFVLPRGAAPLPPPAPPSTSTSSVVPTKSEEDGASAELANAGTTGTVQRKFDDYPRSWSCDCEGCAHPFAGLPHFPVERHDATRDVFYLMPYGCCTASCVRVTLMRLRSATMFEQLALSALFARRFLGHPCEPILALPPQAIRGRSPGGFLSIEEFRAQSSGGVRSGLVRQPPMFFIETWMEETDISAQKRREQLQFERSHAAQSTEEQQQKYLENIERVGRQNRAKKTTAQQQQQHQPSSNAHDGRRAAAGSSTGPPPSSSIVDQLGIQIRRPAGASTSATARPPPGTTGTTAAPTGPPPRSAPSPFTRAVPQQPPVMSPPPPTPRPQERK